MCDTKGNELNHSIYPMQNIVSKEALTGSTKLDDLGLPDAL